jgi:hypothetical protein
MLKKVNIIGHTQHSVKKWGYGGMKMKRTTVLTVFILIISVGLLVSGCVARNEAAQPSAVVSEKPENQQEPQEPAETALSEEEMPVATPAAEVGAESPLPETTGEAVRPQAEMPGYETVTFESSAIVIKYPKFTNLADSRVEDKVNTLIADRVLRNLKDLEGQAVEYELDYQVTYSNPEVISVFFNGYMNFEQSAHPSNVFFTINIDVKNQTALSLSQLVCINEDFIKLLESGNLSSMLFDMDEQVETSLREYLFESGVTDLATELRNADTEGYETYFYLTQESLVLSVNVPHVYGDHVEISIPYERLAGCQTDNLIWLAITPEAFS